MRDPGLERAVHRALLGTTLVIVAIAAIGSLLSWEIAHSWIGQPAPGRGNAYFYLFGQYEFPHLLLLAGTTVGAALYCLTPAPPTGIAEATDWHPPARAMVVALAVVAVARLGSRFVFHDFPLSMDEFNAVFQSRIFAEGRLAAPVPPEWRDLVPAIKPIFVTYRPDDHVWLSSYLPVYAAIRAAFLTVGLGALVNPLLAGLSILVLAAVARRLWTGAPLRAAVALVILATSSQFLITAMSGYAMPAHLFLNLCWLLLYLRGGAGHLFAPWIGALAIGLHNPFPHALFVAPFLARMLAQRKVRVLAYSVGVYLIGALAWLTWWRFALPPDVIRDGSSLFGLPGPTQWAFQAMNLAMTLSWAPPIFGLGIGVAFSQWRALGPTERDLGAGLLLTLAFYWFYLDPQGHGWGYRYLHPVLGSAALLASWGMTRVGETLGMRRLGLVVASTTLIAVVVQFPLRLVEAASFSRPWARAAEYLESIPAPVVAIPAASLWYGFDLVRNDPFLVSPVIAAVAGNDSAAFRAALPLARRAPGVSFVRVDDFRRLGLVTDPDSESLEPPRGGDPTMGNADE